MKFIVGRSADKKTIRVFRNQHKVANNGNVGNKGFYSSKNKLPPVGFDLMITDLKESNTYPTELAWHALVSEKLGSLYIVMLY